MRSIIRMGRDSYKTFRMRSLDAPKVLISYLVLRGSVCRACNPSKVIRWYGSIFFLPIDMFDLSALPRLLKKLHFDVNFNAQNFWAKLAKNCCVSMF